MRARQTQKTADLWAAMPPFAVAAIELATGIIHKRTKAPPTGLYSASWDLEHACRKLWPDADYTIGDMARQYLDTRALHMANMRKTPIGKYIAEEVVSDTKRA